MDSELTFKSGLKDVLPTTFGYIGIGLAFGIVGKTSGLSILAILMMSLMVYAGSLQFVIAGMLAANSPILGIVFAGFLINLRFMLMSTSMAQYFKKESLLQNILLGSLLTDETFALGMNKINYTDRKLNPVWLHTANIISYLVWAAASVVGGLIGNLIPDPNRLGVDFALVAMFIGLLYLQVISDRSKKLSLQLSVILFVLVAFYISLMFMSSNFAILLVTVLGCLFGMVLERWK
ncbi:AzlC family ABC transporter permease [Pediococcus argentinicus]|uniref:Amino acid transport protein n=1 Tax=Pediococcus argentinicus TaxID=480391 RepID=A0A0R2NBK1_9LACO|nr:AzlC family ABC transporter permease [Pediococcus argentinicus]KRO21600.1 amino acid transport protein [Pediococcus argentinicus]NKZ23125.1 AzlC family ABC transporter permease [Pediococcus argentinicus]GEP20277.1 azaleucine resistance protein AzlC [Pediococcus argentinicus]